jgi:hypothetical protein
VVAGRRHPSIHDGRGPDFDRLGVEVVRTAERFFGDSLEKPGGGHLIPVRRQSPVFTLETLGRLRQQLLRILHVEILQIPLRHLLGELVVGLFEDRPPDLASRVAVPEPGERETRETRGHTRRPLHRRRASIGFTRRFVVPDDGLVHERFIEHVLPVLGVFRLRAREQVERPVGIAGILRKNQGAKPRRPLERIVQIVDDLEQSLRLIIVLAGDLLLPVVLNRPQPDEIGDHVAVTETGHPENMAFGQVHQWVRPLLRAFDRLRLLSRHVRRPTEQDGETQER